MIGNEQEELMSKLGGYTFQVEEDPDYPGFYSVFAYKDGSGCEVAGKIGEFVVAVAIAETLAPMTRGKVEIDRSIRQDDEQEGDKPTLVITFKSKAPKEKIQAAVKHFDGIMRAKGELEIGRVLVYQLPDEPTGYMIAPTIEKDKDYKGIIEDVAVHED